MAIATATPTGARALGAAVLLLGAVGADARAQQVERHTITGSDVAIYNLVGVVRAEAGSGSDVVVEVTRRGADAERLRIATGEIGRRQTLRVIYPERRISYRGDARGWGDRSRTTMSVNEDGTFGEGSGNWRESRRVEITSRGDGLDASADIRVLVPSGRKISLFLGVGDASVSNVNGDVYVDVASASITTTGTRGQLLLDTGSGDVRVTDAQGDLELDTGSGSVTVTRVRGPRLRLDTGSGRVRGSELEVQGLDLDTGSGSVSLSGVRAEEVIIDSGSGEVEVGLVANVRSLRIDSGSGDVTLRVPDDFAAELVADTGSGGIEVDFPIQVRKRERGYLSGTIGSGGGRLSIETGSGEVTIRKGR